MAAPSITGDELSGYVGHLTTEQEEKLQLFWLAISKVCGVHPPGAEELSASLKRTNTNTSTNSDKKSATAPKRRFGLMRWSSNEPAADAPAAPEGPEQNDKYGQTKAYHQVLANHKPEDIRNTIWSMIQQDHPDRVALRFLRARKWDVDKALVMLVSAVNWRKNEMKVADIMTYGEEGFLRDQTSSDSNVKKVAVDFMTQQRAGKSFIHGIDKKGRPMCVVKVRLHKIGAQSGESLEKFIVHVIETARLTLEPPVETATIVFDMTGFTLANMDYHPVKFIIQCFEANYPECLGVILVHNAPWIFQGIWRIIRGWLDPVVAAKVQFTNYRAGLEEYIEPSRIIKGLEGDEDWEYKYIEPVAGENDKMKDTATRDKILASREELYTAFEKATELWIRNRDNEQGAQAKAEREVIADKLKATYWDLDPYVRARSLYDRTGDILPTGGANWYGKKEDEVKETAEAVAVEPVVEPAAVPAPTEAVANGTAVHDSEKAVHETEATVKQIEAVAA